MHFNATFVFLLLGLAVCRAASLAKPEEPTVKDALPASDELEEKDRSKKSAIYANPLLGGSRLSALLGLQTASAINVPQYLQQVPAATVLADHLMVPGVQTVGEIVQPVNGLSAVNYLAQPAIVEDIVQPALRPRSYPFYGRPELYNSAPLAAYTEPLVAGGLPYGLYPDAALTSYPYIGASSPYGLYSDAALPSPYIGGASPYGLYSDAALPSPYIGGASPYGLYSDAALLSPYIGAGSPYGLSPYSYLY